MTFSVIIPAYNEERYLRATLALVQAAVSAISLPWEIIVVDNDSQDATGRIAAVAGASVIVEKTHNIGRVRNTGARAATGDVLVFIDADTHVSRAHFESMATALGDPRCLGGACAVRYAKVERRLMRWYLGGWAFWGRLFHMAQGAAQFCRRSTFMQLGGYDESIYMGEDVEFFWRLRRHARGTGSAVSLVEHPPVVTSGRRFDRMPVWKTLLLTHPVFIRLGWRRKGWWKDWYERIVR
jgi:GT2 family glycosyltransferase